MVALTAARWFRQHQTSPPPAHGRDLRFRMQQCLKCAYCTFIVRSWLGPRHHRPSVARRNDMLTQLNALYRRPAQGFLKLLCAAVVLTGCGGGGTSGTAPAGAVSAFAAGTI